MHEPAGASRLVVGDPVVPLTRGEVVADGAVLIVGSRVAEVGSRAALARRHPDAEVVGSAGDVVLPGLVNAHFHSDFHLHPRWLRYPIERGNVHVRALDLDERQLYLRTVERALACLRAGQTTVLDVVYGVPGLPDLGLPAILAAYRDLGMRAAVAVALRDRQHYVHGPDETFLAGLPPDLADRVGGSSLGYPRPVEASLRAFERAHAEGWGARPRSRLLLAPDWTPSVSDRLYRRAAETAAGTGTQLTGHLSETHLEFQHSLDVHGRTPVQRLAGLGVLHERSSWAHVVWATDDDRRVLADSGAAAIVNAGSNLRMGAGLPRAAALRAAGAEVALGTDGMALHHEDLLGEACLAAYLDRNFADIAEEPLDPLTLLAAAQRAGARATGFEDGIGVLRPGGPADLVVLRPAAARRAAATPVDGCALVEWLRGSAVTAAFVDGERVLADGQPLGADVPTPSDARGHLVDAPPLADEWAAAPDVSLALDRAVMRHYQGGLLASPEPRRAATPTAAPDSGGCAGRSGPRGITARRRRS